MERLKYTAVFVLIAVGISAGILVTAPSPTMSDIVAQVRTSVVHIEKQGEWEGSGFVLTQDGVIVTAKHVVEGGGTFIVTFDDGTKATTNLSFADRYHDVGFLKVSVDHPLKSAKVVWFNLRAGDTVFIMGSPLGFENFNSVTKGIIACVSRNLDAKHNEGYGWNPVFQSDCPAYPGDSGGPVFNECGQVIGILVVGVDPSLNFSVPTTAFLDCLNEVEYQFKLMRFEMPVPKHKAVEIPQSPSVPEQPADPNKPDAGYAS